MAHADSGDGAEVTNTSGERCCDSERSSTEGVLRAQLSIQPHPASNCAVVERGTNASSMTQKMKIPTSCLETVEETSGCTPDACGECHVEVTVSNGEKEVQEYLKSSVHVKCICPVFEEHDCIPEIKGVRNGAVIAVVAARDRAVLKDILAGLEAVDATVSIEWLVRGQDTERTVEMDVGKITGKQQEALETALKAGYYETPRETNLTTLAEELSISESAVSQRLNAAETKLVKSFLEE